MKFLRNSLFALAILGLVGLFSCDDDTTDPTNAELIASTGWTLSSASGKRKAAAGGTTDALTNASMTLDLTASGETLSYSTSNVSRAPLFNGTSTSGTWTFTSTTGTSITIDNTVAATLGAAPASGMTSFTITFDATNVAGQNPDGADWDKLYESFTYTFTK